jgi:1,4-dihydroxy-2-naphthoate octaprenyltransferase
MVAAGLSFTILAQPCIVFLNDVHDAEGDSRNDEPSPFSGGSRVIVEGKISASALRTGATICSVFLLSVSVLFAFFAGRPATPLFALATLGLSWLYSAPPLRGCTGRAGLWLQAIGTGTILPLLGGYLLTGDLNCLRPGTLLVLVCLGGANHILTTLPDRRADLQEDKRTYAVRHGPIVSRRHAVQIVLAMTACSPWVLGFLRPLSSVAIIGVCVGLCVSALALLRREDVEARGTTLAFVVIVGAAIQTLLLGWALAASIG